MSHALQEMDLTYEKNLLNKGYSIIGAIDEAGRGPLAGPVVAACVIITKEAVQNISKIKELKEVKDSKKLNEKKREALFKIISDHFQTGVGIYNNNTIDEMNILEATLSAMRAAFLSSGAKPGILIIDGNRKIKNVNLPQNTIIGGDAKIFSIAAASIIAKVTRDEIMKSAAQNFPEYDFHKNKGYGTKSHMAAIKKFGICSLHRKSFEPIKSLLVKEK